MSLLGTNDTGPWAWNGSAGNLPQQVRKSIEQTMQGPPLDEQQVEDLVAYLLTLPPPPSLARSRGELDEAAVLRGKAVFSRQSCIDCHAPNTYTSAATYDVKLKDERGHREFNPPSLRGASQRERLFHDNRAVNLREVFTRFRHGLSEPLKQDDLNDLLAFLRSL